MKKLFLITIILLVLLSSSVFAYDIMQNKLVATDSYILNTSSADNIYVTADSIKIFAPVNKDAMLIGTNVLVQSPVFEDLSVFSNTLIVNNTVGGDIKVAASNVKIYGDVFGDVLGAASDIHIANTSVIGKDVILTGGNIVILGKINGNLIASGNVVKINGVIKGDAQIESSSLELMNDSLILGDLYVMNENNIDESKVMGDIIVMPSKVSNSNAWLFALYSALSIFVLIFLGGLLFLSVSKKHYIKTVGVMNQKSFSALILGLVVFFAIPVISVLIGLTLIGIPFAILLMSFWLVLVISSFVIGGFAAGQLVHGKGRKKKSVVTLLIGAVIVSIVSIIPVLGLALMLYILWAGFGALLMSFGAKLKK